MKSCSGNRPEDARGTGFGWDRDKERKTGPGGQRAGRQDRILCPSEMMRVISLRNENEEDGYLCTEALS